MRTCLLAAALLLPACSDVRDSVRVVMLKPTGISTDDWRRCEEFVPRVLSFPWAEMPLSVSASLAPVRGPLREYMQRTTMTQAMSELSDLDAHCLRERLMAACGAGRIMAGAADPVAGSAEAQAFQEAMERRSAAVCGDADMPLLMVRHVIAREMVNRWAACE